jgi:hypothetical protein
MNGYDAVSTSLEWTGGCELEVEGVGRRGVALGVAEERVLGGEL